MSTMKEEIIKAYQFRHACKEFDSSRKIAEDDFQFILETGRLSPSSYGLEPWRFIIVQDPDLREKLLPFTGGAIKQLPTSSHFVIILSRTKQGMEAEGEHIQYMLREIKKFPEDALEGFTAHLKEMFENKFSDNPALFHEWTSRQSYIALGNMMTAAAMIGIDSCPIEGFDRSKVDQLLKDEGLIENDEFSTSCMVAFGYRKEDPKRPKTRQKMDDIVVWR